MKPRFTSLSIPNFGLTFLVYKSVFKVTLEGLNFLQLNADKTEIHSPI